MSLVPFEKPRLEGQLPDPFDGDGAEQQGLDAPAVQRLAPLRAVPPPSDTPPGEPPRRRRIGGERDGVLPFKRRQKQVPIRRRTPLRRWLRPLATALAIVGTPVGLVLWLFTSSHFALSEWRIEVGERVSSAWVERRLASFGGRNLFELDLRSVEKTLAHPWVAGVDLRKEFPNRLAVRVIERQAVALWRGPRGIEESGPTASGATSRGVAHGLVYLDGEGNTIAPFRARQAPEGGIDLVLLSRAPGGEITSEATAQAVAVELLREIGTLDTDLFDQLAEIQVLGEEDFKIFTADLPFPLLVRAGSLETKTRRLKELLPRLEERHGALSAVDLRFRRRIIVEPSEPAASSARNR